MHHLYDSLYNNLFKINQNDKTLQTILDALQKHKNGFIKVLGIDSRKSWFNWRQNRQLTFILGHLVNFRSTSGPRYLEVLSKTCMSQRQAGNGRKWTRDDFGLGKANHDKSRIITRKRDLKSLKTIKIFWIYFYNFRIPFFLSKKLWILLHIIYFGIIWSLELT